MALLLMVLMLIADGVVADGDNADWVDGSADCDDGNAYLLTMACRSSSLSSLGSLSVQVKSSTTYCASISVTTLHIFFNIFIFPFSSKSELIFSAPTRPHGPVCPVPLLLKDVEHQGGELDWHERGGTFHFQFDFHLLLSLFTFYVSLSLSLFNFTFFRRPFSRQPQIWRPWPDIPLGRSRQCSGSSALSLGSIICSPLFWWNPACLSTCKLSLLRVYSLEDLEESRVDSLSSPDSTGSTFQKTKSKYFDKNWLRNLHCEYLSIGHLEVIFIKNSWGLSWATLMIPK